MKKRIAFKIFIFTALFIYAGITFASSSFSKTKGVKTSYKRYSIFEYKDEEILCEPYLVNKDDWLYKIFRKKGEIAEKDFPHFLIIFKQINPQISNIDAIEPGINILIPLKKVKPGDYDQSTPGNIDVPVIEFSAMSDNPELQGFLKAHTIKKGENISSLMDRDFLEKGGRLSREGLKAFQLANPNIKNINIIYEGTDIYLPDPSIKSQPWFRSIFTAKGKNKKNNPDQEIKYSKVDEYQLLQLKKYSSLIGGTLLSRGKIYFPGKTGPEQVLDLSSKPIIEKDDGSKILIISGDNVNDELLKSAQAYWKDLKIQLMGETLDRFKKEKDKKGTNKNSIIFEQKNAIKLLLSQTNYDYIPDAKIPFQLNKIHLEASFGRIIREEDADILINFGNVYGSALEVLEKKEFKIIAITSQLTSIELARKIFTSLGYATWNNPSFSAGEHIEKIEGVYASRGKEKLFIPVSPMTVKAMNYLEKESIRILSMNKKTTAP